MTKQEVVQRRRLFRFAIPAVVAVVALAAVAVGTKAWQGLGAGQSRGMELSGVWMGMRLTATDSRNGEELGVPPGVKGVLIADVQAGSRAVMAGLAPGDVVTRVDGRDVEGLMDLYGISGKLDVGRQVQVDFLRGGRPMATLLPLADGLPANANAVQYARPLAAPMPAAGNDQWTGGAKSRACVNCNWSAAQ
jgi:S1-C subfamily serine protease